MILQYFFLFSTSLFIFIFYGIYLFIFQEEPAKHEKTTEQKNEKWNFLASSLKNSYSFFKKNSNIPGGSLKNPKLKKNFIHFSYFLKNYCF